MTFVKRKRQLCSDYEAQIGNAITPAARALIASAVSIQISLELIEAEQEAGKPIDAKKHAYLAAVFTRLLDRAGLTNRPGASTASTPAMDTVDDIISPLADNMAKHHGWSKEERDQYFEQQKKEFMAAA
jgi:hypothetical protein